MKTAEENKNSELPFICKENPFVTPEGYFENLPGIITEKCIASEKQNVKRPLFFLPKFYLPMVSGIVAIIIIILLLDLKDKPAAGTSENNQIAMVSDGYAYLDNLIDDDDLDESVLVEAVISDDTSKQAIPVFIDPNVLQNAQLKINHDSLVITNDDIIQYLLDDETISDDPLNNL
jgi:hypothetical protein